MMNAALFNWKRGLAALGLIVGLTATAVPTTGAAGVPNARCAGTLAAGTYRNVTVANGQACTLTASVHITGNLDARAGSDLRSDGATIDGNLHDAHGRSLQILLGGHIGGNLEVDHLQGLAPGTTTNFICATTIAHNLHVAGSATGAPLVIGSTDAGCAQGVTVSHNLDAHNNAGALTIGDSTVGGNLHARNNHGAVRIVRDHVTKNLACNGNNPAAISSGNTAKKFQGQCHA
jgi:hypothetical protein